MYYTQEKVESVVEGRKKGRERVVLQRGMVVRVFKDKEGGVQREVIVKEWSDWIDYWSIDFDYERRQGDYPYRRGGCMEWGVYF